MNPATSQRPILIGFQVHIDTDGRDRLINVFGVLEDDQLTYIDSFRQGPFDTDLEVAQWVWRTVSRAMPPHRR